MLFHTIYKTGVYFFSLDKQNIQVQIYEIWGLCIKYA